MSELEKAAREYCENVKQSTGRDSDPVNAFQSGAQWQAKQSPWISVEERLPETNNGQSLCAILIKTCDGEYSITANICVEFEAERGYATHWMYIPEVNDKKQSK